MKKDLKNYGSSQRLTISQVLKLYKIKGLPEREALILLAHAMNKPKEYLIAHEELICPEHALALLEKRLTGYPLQYILGEVEFYGRKFYVEEGVLIPRWETEGLVELAINYIKKYNLKYAIDIGVGSGVVLITIAAETGINIFGTDTSKKAIEVCTKNLERYNLKCELRLGEFIEPFAEQFNNIQLIVSNPPYVKEGTRLQKEVNFEPREALFAGKDGLNFYKTFFNRYNIEGKIVLMEIGEDQGDFLKDLTGGTVIKDLAGNDRYLLIDKFRKTK
ncbi:MAG: peptide chain release factor N(5)-glutamine methyltransferase [Fervidobacterium sp.]